MANVPFSRPTMDKTKAIITTPFSSQDKADGYKKHLKGASHEIELGKIWYQKKDLEKLEVRGWVVKSTGTCVQITCFSAPFLHSNLFETIPNAAEQCLHANH